MAQPKRRWSKQRTHTRRSTWKKETPNVSECPQGHEPIMAHRACTKCGYYNGRKAVAVKVAEEN